MVALLKGEKVTLKRLYIQADSIRLEPASPATAPLYLQDDEIETLGIVYGLVRMTP